MDARTMDLAKLRAETDFSEMMERFQTRFAGGRTWLSTQAAEAQIAQAPLQLLSEGNLLDQLQATPEFLTPTLPEQTSEIEDELEL